MMTFALAGRLLGAVDLMDAAPASAPGPNFPLVGGGVAALIVLPPDDPEVVKIAARDLAAEVATPPGARAGDFVERGKVVSIHAGHFTGQKHLSGGAGWRSVPGLGRTGSAVTVLPSTTVSSSNAVPSLEYRFHVTTGGDATLRVRLLPTHPLVSGPGLRFAIAIDDGPARPLAVTSGFDPKQRAWSDRVLANATEATLTLPQPLAPGWHTLRLVAVDAGVVVDKIIIDFGGGHSSYDGPAETRIPDLDFP